MLPDPSASSSVSTFSALAFSVLAFSELRRSDLRGSVLLVSFRLLVKSLQSTDQAVLANCPGTDHKVVKGDVSSCARREELQHILLDLRTDHARASTNKLIRPKPCSSSYCNVSLHVLDALVELFHGVDMDGNLLFHPAQEDKTDIHLFQSVRGPDSLAWFVPFRFSLSCINLCFSMYSIFMYIQCIGPSRPRLCPAYCRIPQ